MQKLLFIEIDDPVTVGRGYAAPSQRRPQVHPRLREPESLLQLVGEVTAKERAHHDAGPGAVEAILETARIGDGRVGCLEQHELERIGSGNLLGRHLVTAPVIVEVADEPADVRRGVPGLRHRWIEDPLGIPTIGGNRTDGGLAAAEQIEEGVERERAGKNAA